MSNLKSLVKNTGGWSNVETPEQAKQRELQEEIETLKEQIKKYKNDIAAYEDELTQIFAPKSQKSTKKKTKKLNDLGFYLTLALLSLPWLAMIIYVSIR